MKEDELEGCIEVPEDTLLKIIPPETSHAFKNGHRNAVRTNTINVHVGLNPYVLN